jgi:hypothetical protein
MGLFGCCLLFFWLLRFLSFSDLGKTKNAHKRETENQEKFPFLACLFTPTHYSSTTLEKPVYIP